MHIPEHIHIAGTIAVPGADSNLLLEGAHYYGMDSVLLALRAIVSYILALLGWWLYSIGSALREFFNDPSACVLHSLGLLYAFFHRHPHILYLTSLSLFFGPIIVLLPFLLLHEVAILLLFNLSFITHGLIPGRVEDQYDSLKEHFTESREQVFASVDAASAIFNKWTTDYFALMVARLLAGIVGLYMLYSLWGARV